MINKLSKYIEIKEDKFRNQVSITQKKYSSFVWNREVPWNQRTLNNSFDSEYIQRGSAMSSYFDSLFSNAQFRVEKCEGNIKIFIDFYGELRSDIKRDELIIRLNDSQNYPLPFAYYDIITLIDDYGNTTGKWSHTFGFEIPVELLKAICEANMVESNPGCNWSWQTNARLIYNIAIDNQKYYNELANLVESIFRKEEEEKQYEKKFRDETDKLWNLIDEKYAFLLFRHELGADCSADEVIRKFCSEKSFTETLERINALIPLFEELAELFRSKYPGKSIYERGQSFDLKTTENYISVLKAAKSYIEQELDKKRKKRLGLTFGILAIAVTITLLCVN